MGILSSITIASGNDVATTVVICVAVVLGLLIVAVATNRIIKKIQDTKKKELDKRNAFELSKIASEQNWKNRTKSYDTAWRTIEQSWKDGNKVSEEEKKKAWEYVKFIWSEDMVTSSATAPESK